MMQKIKQSKSIFSKIMIRCTSSRLRKIAGRNFLLPGALVLSTCKRDVTGLFLLQDLLKSCSQLVKALTAINRQSVNGVDMLL